jgi:hypothetical protein
MPGKKIIMDLLLYINLFPYDLKPILISIVSPGYISFTIILLFVQLKRLTFHLSMEIGTTTQWRSWD